MKKVMTETVMMPKELTAENGAKGLMSGEFNEVVETACPVCFEYNEPDCTGCSGTQSIEITVPVSWPTIKSIYAMAVKNLGE